MGKASYSAYVADRLSGFGGAARRRRSAQDLRDFPRYGRRLVEIGGTTPAVARLACIGPVAPADRRPLRAELEDFRRAVDAARPAAAFLTAASPGTIAIFMENQHYPSHDAYVAALADAMREEYEAIAAAGFVLQIDAPDLAMGRHLMFKDSDEAGFLAAAAMQVEAINHATANIPPERMRLHLCWGNYQGPHHRDIPLARIVDIVFQARPALISVEGANPAPRVRMDRAPRLAAARRQGVDPRRHRLHVELHRASGDRRAAHPPLRRRRRPRPRDGRLRLRLRDLRRASPNVDPDIAWAKLESLVEGAARASDALWRRGG